MSLLLTRLLLSVVLKPRPAAKERGDVPGWVLITVMTAGLVAVIWTFAATELQAMLKRALESVSGR